NAEITLADLFKYPTVAAFTRQIEQAKKEGGYRLPPIVAAPRADRMPLSYAQQRLWFLDKLEPLSSAYNISTVIKFEGNLQTHILRRAINEIIRRHEVLRSRYDEQSGEPFQHILPELELELAEQDLTALGEQGAYEEAIKIARQEASRGFDLRQGPMVRAKLMKTGAEEWVAVFVMHHIVSDGWSMGVMIKELGASYEGYARGAESGMKELEIQYADYAVWQREWLTGEVLQEQIEYWKGQIGNKATEIKTDRERKEVKGIRGG